MLVQITIDVRQLDDVRSVAALKVLGDDLTETLFSLSFAILKNKIKLENPKESSV
jgi:hypothetical protein